VPSSLAPRQKKRGKKSGENRAKSAKEAETKTPSWA